MEERSDVIGPATGKLPLARQRIAGRGSLDRPPHLLIPFGTAFARTPSRNEAHREATCGW
jgi:hypothetical protein